MKVRIGLTLLSVMCVHRSDRLAVSVLRYYLLHRNSVFVKRHHILEGWICKAWLPRHRLFGVEVVDGQGRGEACSLLFIYLVLVYDVT
jgi:hypothetical protein